MAIYAIGDIQGCYHSFRNLLAEIGFDYKHDSLWLVGDLVNRGSGSLDVLRWVFQNQSRLVTVLGNHDLHTLVVSEGFVKQHRSDTIQPLLDAPDASELLTWLRHQPLVHFDHGYLMVHAGLLPQWSIPTALMLGKEVEAALQDRHYRDFMRAMYGNQPNLWNDNLTGNDRLRVITNAMTRLRVCKPSGEMEFEYKGEVDNIPGGLMPWFEIEARESRETKVVFGHWSALGLLKRDNLIALDTGCLWGGKLTAMRLDDQKIYQVTCSEEDHPLSIDFNQ